MRHPRTAAALTSGILLFTTSACAEEAVFSSAVSEETDPGAAAISVPADASVFRSSATGPDRVNYAVDEGDPMSFVDPALLDDDGNLPEDMSVTEAQSLQVLSKLEKLLTERKLKLYEVATVRVYLAADGRDGADFDGWERAYRRYFANVDRDTGRSLLTEPVETTAQTTAQTTARTTALSAPVDPSGSAAGPASGAARPAERPSARPSTSGAADPSATDGATTSAAESSTETSTETSSEASPVTELYPGTDNRTRPTLVTVGVAQQPVAGWLVQVEIEAVHGAD